MYVSMQLDDIDTSCLDQFKKVLEKETGGQVKIGGVCSVKSAQQRVFILTIVRTKNEDPTGQASTRGKIFMDAIERGGKNLVLRIWKGAARWWNLNSNAKESCIDLATAEVTGYKVARQIFNVYYSQSPGMKGNSGPKINIPKLLYFENNASDDTPLERKSNTSNPWAVFSYVKERSSIELSEGRNLEFCNKFIKDMVKIRREFGFDELHPRHGRVGVENALQYAKYVLDAAVLPMHFTCFTLQSKDVSGTVDMMKDIEIDINILIAHSTSSTGKAVAYSDMIRMFQDRIRNIRKSIRKESQSKLILLVGYLESFIQRLLTEEEIVQGFPLVPVLCHMDLQPQNMVLCQTTEEPLLKIPMITSILDWEESCYADARFEIMLLCRKVLANRDQADVLWQHYSEQVKAYTGLTVGPIEPWLKLESVHSLLTMCMQGMNLLQGGRNPWEEQSDLLGKIERELSRIKNDLGWEAF